MGPQIVLAHGAGAPSSSEWMQGWARRLGTIGRVTTFDYPYMAAGRRRPDALPALVEAHRRVVAERAHPGAELVLAGKSMGSRIGCHLATESDGAGPRISALICFGYPLRSQSGKLRDEVLLALRKPVLFVQGTRDALCPLDVLERVRAGMSATSELFVVEGGDHSLQVTKGALRRAAETQDDVDARILEAVRHFLEQVLGG